MSVYSSVDSPEFGDGWSDQPYVDVAHDNGMDAPGRRVGMGDNVGGNLGLRVARRHDPHVVGLVIADHDETLWVACAENGRPLIENRGDWVAVGSLAHREALDRLEDR